MEQIAEPFIRARAVRHLEKGRIVSSAPAPGNPYFTTDTAASLRAVETRPTRSWKGTRVDGIYSADPEKDSTALRYERLTFTEVYEQGSTSWTSRLTSATRTNCPSSSST